MDTQSQELTIIDNSLETFKEAGAILRNNQTRATKALAIGRNIMADYESNGRKMTPELDARMQNYLANCSGAKSGMNEDRKAITQVLTLISKAFTTEENKIDVTNKDTVAFQIQQIRNDYARQLHEEEQTRLREVEQKKQKDQEAINVKAECEKWLVQHVGKFIGDEKQRVNTKFNAITLDTFDAQSAALENYSPVYPYKNLQDFKHNITSRILSAAEINELLYPLIESKFESISLDFATQLNELKAYLIDRLPSKKRELVSIREHELETERERQEQERIRKEQETANAKQREILKQQQKESEERQRKIDEERNEQERQRLERERQEQERIELENRQRQQEQEQKVEQNKEVEQTLALFGTEVSGSEVVTNKPEVRLGYEIEVTGPAGWMQIFQLWFNEKGKSLDNDKIAATKMEAMKTFCEKLAHKEDVKKIVSNFLIYKPSFKAVNRKAE